MTDKQKRRLEEYVAKVVAQAPPLTDDQLNRIAALLNAGRRHANPARKPS